MQHSEEAAATQREGGRIELGAHASDGGVTFSLWSDRATKAAVALFDGPEALTDRFPLEPRGGGIFTTTVPRLEHGALYKFELDGELFPDPYARYLPHGVHGPARVERRRRVAGLEGGMPTPLSIYELHIGAFTAEGTFRAAIDKLAHVAALGITAIELMPVSSFAGSRGWGYDGVAHFAPFDGYGEPEDLRMLVEAAHALGLGVILDVVYNHFGPAGNYLPRFSDGYFAKGRKSAWGDALDYAHIGLRRYVVDNVKYWLDEFGFDGLRLDATHGIVDESVPHIIEEIVATAHALAPRRWVCAEDDRNDASLVTEAGLDALWSDDFHHGVRTTLAGEQDGYYGAYLPGCIDLARTIERGWLFEGQRHPLTQQPKGTSASKLGASNLVYFIQNHDQIGNRAHGTRLSHDTSLDAHAAMSMLHLFLPMTPLLFMGQEWAATSPFLYFTDHEPELGERICKGRRDELAGFAAFREKAVRERIPNPQSVDSFTRSKLDWRDLKNERHARMLELYRTMLALRRADPVMANTGRESMRCWADSDDFLVVDRWLGDESRTLMLNTGELPALCALSAQTRIVAVSREDGWQPGLVMPATAIMTARGR